MDSSTNDMVKKYLNSLTKQEKIVYEIAKQHLESSFDIEKSIGYLKFVEKQKN